MVFNIIPKLSVEGRVIDIERRRNRGIYLICIEDKNPHKEIYPTYYANQELINDIKVDQMVRVNMGVFELFYWRNFNTPFRYRKVRSIEVIDDKAKDL